jgi:hypothetical protein
MEKIDGRAATWISPKRFVLGAPTIPPPHAQAAGLGLRAPVARIDCRQLRDGFLLMHSLSRLRLRGLEASLRRFLRRNCSLPEPAIGCAQVPHFVGSLRAQMGRLLRGGVLL